MLFRCPNFNLMAWTKEATDTAIGQAHILAYLRCKQWDCEFCSVKNAQIWRAHLIEQMAALGGAWYFVTLTARPSDEGFEQSYKALAHGIDVMFKRLRRVFGVLDYVRVYEAHTTRDALHAHLIIRGFTQYVAVGASQKHVPMFVPSDHKVASSRMWSIRSFVKHSAWQSGLGYIADVQPVKNEYAVHYVVKYLTKDQQRFKIKGLRHVQTGGAIDGLRKASDLEWKAGSYVKTYDFPDGKPVLIPSTGEVLKPHTWEDNQRWHDETLFDVEIIDGYQ